MRTVCEGSLIYNIRSPATYYKKETTDKIFISVVITDQSQETLFSL